MNFKTILNSSVLFIGLSLAAYSQLNGYRLRFNIESVPVEAAKDPEVATETWQVKEGSIYDGDTLRVVRGSDEQKIRFCGIDAPEKNQELGTESRDHLRSLVDIGKGELLLVPVEKDRYGRTVAEVYVKDSRDTAINLNVQMVTLGITKSMRVIVRFGMSLRSLRNQLKKKAWEFGKVILSLPGNGGRLIDNFLAFQPVGPVPPL
jgi:endonuclease YncB( thermonuclease family)